MAIYPDITEVRPLDADDDAVMRELHEVLSRHGALSRFGVTLLHQHFDLADDEVMLEATDRTGRVQQMRPALRRELDGVDSKDTSWTLEFGSPRAMSTCLQFPNSCGD